jgi:hypothetical protein
MSGKSPGILSSCLTHRMVSSPICLCQQFDLPLLQQVMSASRMSRPALSLPLEREASRAWDRNEGAGRGGNVITPADCQQNKWASRAIVAVPRPRLLLSRCQQRAHAASANDGRDLPCAGKKGKEFDPRARLLVKECATTQERGTRLPPCSLKCPEQLAHGSGKSARAKGRRFLRWRRAGSIRAV